VSETGTLKLLLRMKLSSPAPPAALICRTLSNSCVRPPLITSTFCDPSLLVASALIMY
jgi:hypothetical protein